MSETQGNMAHVAAKANTSTEQILARRKELAEFEQMGYSKLEPLSEGLEEFWVNIPLSDDWLSRTLVVRPKPISVESFFSSSGITTMRTQQTRPLIIHFHGGGFGAGSPIQVAHPARLFAEHLNATVLCPSYRLAPENPWPQAMKDGIQLVQFISSNHCYHYGANPANGMILGGVSAGASIAAVVAALISNNPVKFPLLRPLTGVFISVPMLLVDSILPPEYQPIWTSRQDNRNAEYFNTASIDGILDNMKCTDYESAWFSPVNFFSLTGNSGETPSDNLPSHPPTYLQAMGLDPLRDDAIIYEKLLSAANIKTKIDLFLDDPHNALTTLNPVFGTKSKNPTIEEGTLNGVVWLIKEGLNARK